MGNDEQRNGRCPSGPPLQWGGRRICEWGVVKDDKAGGERRKTDEGGGCVQRCEGLLIPIYRYI